MPFDRSAACAVACLPGACVHAMNGSALPNCGNGKDRSHRIVSIRRIHDSDILSTRNKE
jgi:hypothetical protein